MIKQLIPVNFCLKCKGCCRFSKAQTSWSVSLLKEEAGELLNNNKIRPVPYEDYYICPLLNLEDNKCKIYGARPFECQLYPFLIRKHQKKVFLAVDLKCLFANDNLESKEFKEYIGYLSDFLNGSGGGKVLKNNPQIIKEYGAVVNLGEIKVDL